MAALTVRSAPGGYNGGCACSLLGMVVYLPTLRHYAGGAREPHRVQGGGSIFIILF